MDGAGQLYIKSGLKESYCHQLGNQTVFMWKATARYEAGQYHCLPE